MVSGSDPFLPAPSLAGSSGVVVGFYLTSPIPDSTESHCHRITLFGISIRRKQRKTNFLLHHITINLSSCMRVFYVRMSRRVLGNCILFASYFCLRVHLKPFDLSTCLDLYAPDYICYRVCVTDPIPTGLLIPHHCCFIAFTHWR